jgi:hypothetical protein
MRPYRIVLALACLLILNRGSAAAAPAAYAYTDRANFYSVTYPATWTRVRVPGTQFAIVRRHNYGFGPTTTAGMLFDAVPGTADAQTLLSLLRQEVAQQFGGAGDVSYEGLAIPGGTGVAASFYIVTGTIPLIHGFAMDQKVYVFLAEVAHHQRVYHIQGFLLVDSMQDLSEVLAIVNYGIRFL